MLNELNTTEDNSDTVVEVSVDSSVFNVAISRDNSLEVYDDKSVISVLIVSIVSNVKEDKSDNSLLILLFAACI